MGKKRGLGTGLSELLSEVNSTHTGTNTTAGEASTNDAIPAGGRLSQLPVDRIMSGRYQPRKHMDQVALQELADSIRAQGIIQPIVVRKTINDGYEIVAGERRWRAAQMAGLDKVR